MLKKAKPALSSCRVLLLFSCQGPAINPLLRYFAIFVLKERSWN